MARGTLRIFLGAAPGVGKTYAMLEEAHRLGSAATDVVVAVVDGPRAGRDRGTHRRARIDPAAQRRVPRHALEEMDVDAVLARRPAHRPRGRICPLQHPRQPPSQALGGRRRAARRRDQRALHRQRPAPGLARRRRRGHHRTSPGETVPDDVVRKADQIELVDISPELLRQRLSSRQHLSRRENRRRPRQLLPARQPLRAARARAALAGRPRGRRPRQVPGRTRDR